MKLGRKGDEVYEFVYRGAVTLYAENGLNNNLATFCTLVSKIWPKILIYKVKAIC